MDYLDNTLVVDAFKIFFFKTFELLLPLLGFSTIVVLIVGVFMAATQIQEQSIPFIFKMLSLGVVMWFYGPWMFDELVLLIYNHIDNIPNLIK